ncbi:MAG: hypothetical protein HeimC3_25030 [Candidatus Heimdallarchaeota archaeon LC_3]|nr:MAG: hypothetical protein HeimC3_25030 [Candidatus Heimdallarchaeota archaeon LC_3]
MKSIPDQPVDWDIIFSIFKNEVIPRLNSVANKHFLAYIPGDPAPPAMIGAMIHQF